MDQAPALVHAGIVQKPLHRARTETRPDFLDLRRLLGGMDVQRSPRCERRGEGDPLRVHRPQRMNGHPGARVRIELAHRRVRLLPQTRKAIRRVREPDLSGVQRLAAATAVPIEDRQQGQPDPRLCRRGGDAARKLRGTIIGRAARLMVDIVELGHRGETGLEHPHLGEGRDRLELVGTEPLEKPVHQRSPGPEAVARIGTPPFGEAGHRALKGVAVQIDGRGEENPDATSPRGRSRLYGGDTSVPANLHPHVAPPSVGGQGVLGQECFRSPHRLAVPKMSLRASAALLCRIQSPFEDMDECHGSSSPI